jgi:hypothetical protein
MAPAATNAGRVGAGTVVPAIGGAARTAGQAAASPLRAALPQSIKNFARDVADEAVGDAISNTTGISAPTAPSVGGTTYQLAKAAAISRPGSPTQTVAGATTPPALAAQRQHAHAHTGAQPTGIAGAQAPTPANTDLYPASMQGWIKA